MKVSEAFGIRFEVYSAEELKEMTRELCRIVRESGFTPTLLVGLGRGGWPVLRYCSDFLGIERAYTVKVEYYVGVGERARTPKLTQPLPKQLTLKGEKVLIVDDVLDTGESMKFLLDWIKEEKKAEEIKIGVLHYKPWSIVKPDYYVRETSAWIVYDWEKCETLRKLLHKDPKADREELIRRFLEMGFSEKDLDIVFKEI